MRFKIEMHRMDTVHSLKAGQPVSKKKKSKPFAIGQHNDCNVSVAPSISERPYLNAFLLFYKKKIRLGRGKDTIHRHSFKDVAYRTLSMLQEMSPNPGICGHKNWRPKFIIFEIKLHEIQGIMVLG